MTKMDAGHRPRKRFGQNFLHDKHIIEQIIQHFVAEDEFEILEIGPGKGALTLPLLKRAGRLHVVEIDTDLAEILALKCQHIGELKLHIGDALHFDCATISDKPLQIIGNLPYNISTPLLFHLLKQLPHIKKMLFMLQNELVNRICAQHNEKDYGRLSVMVQAQCQVEKLFEVPPSAFSPVPKVTSAIIQLLPDPARSQSIDDPGMLEQLVRQAFGQRRKTLRNALRTIVHERDLQCLSISADARPENISVDAYIALANLLYKQQNQ